MKNNSPALFFLVLLMAGGLFPAQTLALKDDRNQPIEISSDSAERDEKLGVTVYHGNVEIKQGSILIQAETVTIKTHVAEKSGQEELEEIITVGKPSRIQQQTEANGGEWVVATATTIHYDVKADTITLIESADLKQGGRSITGDRIRYDISAQKVLADSAATKNPKPERVTVTIHAKKSSGEKKPEAKDKTVK